jgi:hypothetical protein
VRRIQRLLQQMERRDPAGAHRPDFCVVDTRFLTDK